jgi:hypothetical protein
LLVVPLGAVVLALALPAVAPGDTFSYTGAEQIYMVPVGVTRILVSAVGAPGGAGNFGAAGGLGASASGVLSVTSGELIYVEVGGPGQAAPAGRLAQGSYGGAGGFNGGGVGGGTPTTVVDVAGGGGGASDVRSLSLAEQGSLASRLVVAAGGGGGAGQSSGGKGGDSGNPGHDGPVTGGVQAGGGGSGALTAGGSPGAAGVNGAPGCGGGPGTGGCGAGQASAAGGGGGGGLYGGGGGGSDGNDQGGGGGGGGSSYISSQATNASFGLDGTRTPHVTITPSPVCADLAAITPVVGSPITIALSCSVPAGVTQTFAIVSPPAHGTLGTIEQGGGSISYTPQPGYSGSDSFAYRTTDAAGTSNVATVTITVPQTPPRCVDVASRTPVGGGTVTVAMSCSVPSGATPIFHIVSAPAHGTLAAVNQAAGWVSYTPQPGFSGVDRFTYQGSDQGGASNVATATVTVRPALNRVNSTMTWTFQQYRSYATVRSLVVQGVPWSARIEVSCRGKGCPSEYAITAAVARKRCKGTQCRPMSSPPLRDFDLGRQFRGRHLAFGTRITIEIVKPGWVGKIYIFKIKSWIGPEIACLAPGSIKPGQDC